MHEYTNYLVLYLAGGVITVGLCWVYDRITLKLQGYYDEQPMRLREWLLVMATWPIVLVTRTLALPYQLWIAWEARQSK